ELVSSGSLVGPALRQQLREQTVQLAQVWEALLEQLRVTVVVRTHTPIRIARIAVEEPCDAREHRIRVRGVRDAVLDEGLRFLCPLGTINVLDQVVQPLVEEPIVLLTGSNDLRTQPHDATSRVF